MKILIIPILAVLLAEFVTSCIGAVYNRSVVSNTRNHAEPYATVNNSPLEHDDSVSAERTTDLNAKATVATDNATATQDSAAGGKEGKAKGAGPKSGTATDAPPADGGETDADADAVTGEGGEPK